MASAQPRRGRSWPDRGAPACGSTTPAIRGFGSSPIASSGRCSRAQGLASSGLGEFTPSPTWCRLPSSTGLGCPPRCDRYIARSAPPMPALAPPASCVLSPLTGWCSRGNPETFSSRALLSPEVAGSGEAAVEIEGGADEGQVREGLREVAEVLRLKPELLAVQPQVIGVAEHLLEEE